MYIESVKLLKTLKAGKRIWLEGVVLRPPLPKEILDEILYNTGTVHVVGMPEKLVRKEIHDMISKPEMKTPDLKLKTLVAETNTSQTVTEAVTPPPAASQQPKKLLVVRGRGKGKKK
jgi:hypothetical protein